MGGAEQGGCGSGGSGTCRGHGDRQWRLPRFVSERAEGAPTSAAVAASTVTGRLLFTPYYLLLFFLGLELILLMI